MWVVSVPLSVQVNPKKKFSLNLNQYRNAHYFTLNNAKIEFAKIVKPRLVGIPKMEAIRMSYIIYPRTLKEFDIMNVGSVVDKFFSDCLIQEGINIIPDDNLNHVTQCAFGFGAVDKNNPRCDVVIEKVA